MVEFCQSVAATLRAWKFPFTGAVSWSEEEFDLVIGNENRGGMGKGFRAVTHAAFTVSLMRYCRAKGLPHPGIVILDTPLNPFKGPDALMMKWSIWMCRKPSTPTLLRTRRGIKIMSLRISSRLHL